MAPRLDTSSRERVRVGVIQRAVQYQEIRGHPATRDWVAHIESWRTQLESDLRWGHLRRGRAFGTTDDEIRAMLYMLGLVMDIPTQAEQAYENLRAADEHASRERDKAAARFGSGGLEPD